MFVVVAVCALLQGHTALAAPTSSVGAREGADARSGPRPAGLPHPVRLAASTDEALQQGAQKARDRFLEGDFQGAVAAADALQKLFEQGPAFRADDAAWMAFADSRLTRALALRRLGKEEAADDELLALAVVRPTYAPDASFAPPKVVSRFQELREQLLNGPTVAVTVEITGAGALFLDGRAMPAGVLDVLPGTHWFGVDGKGQRLAVNQPRELRLQGTTTTATIDDGPDPQGPDPKGPDVVVPPVDPPLVVAEDGPPWLLIGLGTAGAVAVVAAVVGVAVIVSQPPAAINPGGTTVKVDASKLDPRDGG